MMKKLTALLLALLLLASPALAESALLSQLARRKQPRPAGFLSFLA